MTIGLNFLRDMREKVCHDVQPYIARALDGLDFTDVQSERILHNLASGLVYFTFLEEINGEGEMQEIVFEYNVNNGILRIDFGDDDSVVRKLNVEAEAILKHIFYMTRDIMSNLTQPEDNEKKNIDTFVLPANNVVQLPNKNG